MTSPHRRPSLPCPESFFASGWPLGTSGAVDLAQRPTPLTRSPMPLRHALAASLIVLSQSALVGAPQASAVQARKDQVFSALLRYLLQRDAKHFQGPLFVQFNEVGEDYASNNLMLARLLADFPRISPMSRTSSRAPFYDRTTHEKGLQLAILGFEFLSSSRVRVHIRITADDLVGSSSECTLRCIRRHWRVTHEKPCGIS
jgi:hypothetical protein